MTAWYLYYAIRNVKIQNLHVPKRGALHGDILSAIFNLFFCHGDLNAEFRKK